MMEDVPPTWIDKKFMRDVLEEEKSNDRRITVVNLDVEPAVPLGSNYTGRLYRVHVQYKMNESAVLESTSLIVKSPLITGFFDESSSEIDLFDNEIKVYTKIIPKMNIKIQCKFSPEYFSCPIKNVLVLEDLKQRGYVVCDKSKQLDYFHCKAVIIKLAKFHASSVACYHETPIFIEKLGKECVFANGVAFESVMKPWLAFSMKTVGRILKETAGCTEISDLLINRADRSWESAVNICKPKTKGLNVLNHGDLWINNTLFKYDNLGKVVDVVFIDFQIPRFSSPVIDLIYYTWTSANEEVREHKLKDLYKIYLDTLNDTLEELGCMERMTTEEFHEDLKAATDWALLMICHLLPLMMSGLEEAPPLGEFSTEDFQTGKCNERLLKMYNGKNFRSLLPRTMEQLLAWISS